MSFSRMSTMLVALLLGTTTTGPRGHTAPHSLHHPQKYEPKFTDLDGNATRTAAATAGRAAVQQSPGWLPRTYVTNGSRGGWSTDGTRNTHPHTIDVCRRARRDTRNAAANKTSKTNARQWPVQTWARRVERDTHTTHSHTCKTKPTPPRRRTWRRRSLNK